MESISQTNTSVPTSSVPTSSVPTSSVPTSSVPEVAALVGLNFLVNPRKVSKPNVTKVEPPNTNSPKRITRSDRIVPDASLLLRKNRRKNFFLEKGREKGREKITETYVEPHLKLDENWHIIQLLKARMKLGADRYGHGLRVYDDTREYGTQEDSWEEMGLEEMLDGLVYLSAAIIRRDREKRYNTHQTNDDIIYDSYRKRLDDSWFKHKKITLI